MRLDSLLTINSPKYPAAEALARRAGLFDTDLTIYLDFTKLLQDKLPEIIQTGRTTKNKLVFVFNKRMQLTDIHSLDEKQQIRISYRKDEPSEILFKINKLGEIRLQVEQFMSTACCEEQTDEEVK
jgi:hypothetical protein